MTASQKRRFWQIFISVIVVAVGVSFIIYASRMYMDAYILPKQLVLQKPDGRHLRLGGFVKKQSLVRHDLDIDFMVYDDAEQVRVHYHGIPPALFREGQGVLVEGRWLAQGFVADRILAKHDENYRPPGVRSTG